MLFLSYGLWLVFGMFAAHNANAAKILGLFPHASESHFAVMRSIVSELAHREHNVTVYSSHGLSESIDNVKEIVIEPEFPFWSHLQKYAAPKGGGLQELSRLSTAELQNSLAAVGAAGMEYFLGQKPLQELLKLSTEDFDYDLIIIDLFYTEALLAIGHKHKKPMIGIVNTNFADYINMVQECLVPNACSPIDFDNYEQNMGYWQRVANVRTCIGRRKQFVRQHYWAQEQAIKTHFKITTTVQELQAELAVLLINNHVPLLTPRPLLQNIIPAGGLHINAPRELPWHIKRFLDDSRVGVIYMHLGNEQLCAELPKEKLGKLFDVLGKRKERILWTCHDVHQLAGLPNNILIQHVVPQTDILAHPHVRIFITNGDLLSLQEGIIRNVPLLGLPIFKHEVDNMKLAIELGVGIQLDHANVSKASLDWALGEILKSHNQYALQIRKISTEYRDRPLGALATTIFWVDYVLRHNGGAQIKTHGIGISSSQLHLFDLFIFYFIGMFGFILLLLGVCYLALFIWRQKQTDKLYTKLS